MLLSIPRFPGRISATSAIPLVYDKMPSNVKVELEKIYLSLCKDETPIVRRNACLNLGLMCEKVNLLSIDAFTASLKVLSHDDQVILCIFLSSFFLKYNNYKIF